MLTLDFAELHRYTLEERDKWRHFFDLHPDAMDAPIQTGGRFPTGSFDGGGIAGGRAGLAGGCRGGGGRDPAVGT